MAVSELIEVNRRLAAYAAPPLFQRLPPRLFGPLAAPNRERYWSLLCRLHMRRFGPDAPLPPSEGYIVRDIILDIERELDEQDAWESEEDSVPGTPLNIRAIEVFHKLVDSGWLRTGRHGAEKVVSMSPTIAHFLNQLITFAESGPIFVSGKVNSIYATLCMVTEDEADGGTLAEAAQLARNLLEHIRNTSTIIRDLMDSLNTVVTPAQYLYKFFNDYIERVFIGDYRELRTREHPLSKRHQILRTVEQLDESPSERERLIAWYERKQFPGDLDKAERQYERDVARLLELSRIDEYLNRLDDEIRRANRRALAYLDYSVRTVRPIDQLIQAAIANVKERQVFIMSDPFPPAEMASGENLAEPRRLVKRPSPSGLRNMAPSPEDLARARLMLKAREARTITPPKLGAFVVRQLQHREAVDSRDMQLAAVGDIRAYQTLSTVSLAMTSSSERLKLQTKSIARGFAVTPQGIEEEPHRFISGKAYSVVGAAHKNKKETLK
jgi:hypothetical protein